MLRANGVICGTSTTGTGALTLAACPQPPGGLDFYAWLTAAGFNFVNGAAVLVSYTIIEYTDATFANVKQSEDGEGTVTLGASLTATTLARTTIKSKATGLNAAGATPTYSAPTAITIGTAANTLVFVGASASETLAFDPYIDTGSASSSTYGVPPLGISQSNGARNLVHLEDVYSSFIWAVPMLVKRATFEVSTSYTGGTTNAYARIYASNSSGQPGKLLYDFGLVGSAGTSLNSTGRIQSGASGSGFYLAPGEYFMDFLGSFTGGSGTPQITVAQSNLNSGRTSINTSISGFFATNLLGASSGTAGAAPDPANLTSYGARNSSFSLAFGLSPT